MSEAREMGVKLRPLIVLTVYLKCLLPLMMYPENRLSAAVRLSGVENADHFPCSQFSRLLLRCVFSNQLMEAPAEDLGAILQANCDAADPWADKVMRYGDDYAQDDDVDNGLESEGEEGEDDDEEARDEAAESYVATKQISAAAATGAAASSPLQENSVVVGKGGDVDCETSGIEEGWQLVTENSAQEDDADDDHGKTVKPRQTTTTAHGEGKGKVELGERERARTFDTKERLRAGLYS